MGSCFPGLGTKPVIRYSNQSIFIIENEKNI